VVEPNYRVPPAATLLGARYLGRADDSGRFRIGFDGADTFRDLAGNVHGGLLAAMLDEVIASTVTAATGSVSLGVTISMNVQILRTVPPGPLVGEGTITLMGRNISFAEAQLLADDSLVARATGCCRLVFLDTERPGGPID
jgi:uncharacterized protein (TIGR00369 family)